MHLILLVSLCLRFMIAAVSKNEEKHNYLLQQGLQRYNTHEFKQVLCVFKLFLFWSFYLHTFIRVQFEKSQFIVSYFCLQKMHLKF